MIEELAASGIAICATINFSVSQAIAVSESYRKGIRRAKKNNVPVKPCFAVQQIGRVDDYIRDIVKEMNLDISENEITQAGLTIAKRSYEIALQEGYEAIIMPAGLRGVYHVTELAGANMVFSLHPRMQKMVLDYDPEREIRINIPIDKKVIDKLMKIPEFVRAYEPDGLKRNEYFTFGVVQKTLSQFVQTGWVPLEIYGNVKESLRWT